MPATGLMVTSLMVTSGFSMTRPWVSVSLTRVVGTVTSVFSGSSPARVTPSGMPPAGRVMLPAPSCTASPGWAFCSASPSESELNTGTGASASYRSLPKPSCSWAAWVATMVTSASKLLPW